MIRDDKESNDKRRLYYGSLSAMFFRNVSKRELVPSNLGSAS